jgi:hypothetical protein
MGMGMGINPYPPVYMGDPMGLFLCRRYGYGVVILGGYLPIAISTRISQETTPIAIPTTPGTTAYPCLDPSSPSGEILYRPSSASTNSTNRERHDAADPLTYPAEDGMATEITRPMSNLFSAIPDDARARLPFTFHHVERHFNHYDSIYLQTSHPCP